MKNDYVQNCQDIQMHGMNDSIRSDPKFHTTLEEHEVETKFGVNVRVHVQRGKKETALVTFHDIGTNYVSFLSFFNYPEMRVILDNFTVYHISAPGHQNYSKDINNEYCRDEQFNLLSSTRNSSDQSNEIFTISRESRRQNVTSNYPNMNELAEIVADVVDHFEMKYFLGVGVGAGSNVLTRYGLLHPVKLLGLFLINPNDTTTGYYHWTRAIWNDIPYMKTGVITDWIQGWLLDHRFGACTERNLDLEQSHLQLLDELDPMAVAGYIESYMNRTALGMVRPYSSLDSNVPTLKTDAMLVSGEMATDLCRAMFEMNGNMDPTKTQFISVSDSTGAVMDEAPDKLAVLLLSYIRNLGMLVTITPEKLQKAALALQIEHAKAIHGLDPMRVAYECGAN